MKASIGMEVYDRSRTDFNKTTYYQKGVIVGIEAEGKGYIIVRWDGSDFDVAVGNRKLVTKVGEDYVVVER